jgi:hypothetical protein
MYFVGVPLLIVPFAIYNIFAFLIPGVNWGAPFASVTLHSGAQWQIAPGDILIAFSILILLVELVKLTRLGVRSWVDHLLSFALFAAMTAEFLTVQTVATPTFFLLLVISFVDFVGGIVSALGARAARRRALQVDYAPYPAPAEAPRPEPAPPAPRPAPAPQSRIEPTPEIVAEPKPEPQLEPKTESKTESKPDPKPPSTSSEPSPA